MKNTVPNDYLRKVVHALCVGGASTLTLGAISVPSHAADTTTAAASDELNEIVVTGIRASLQQSLDIKRDHDGIVDAISAEDIGTFPDNSIAEAMQRIPGVSVSRGTSSMGGVPTTNGQAAEITVRGFGPTYNETLFDGRPVASGIGNRGYDFSSVGANFVGQVDVLKTPDATLSSGAIGATINIMYPKPFDHPGLQLAGSVSASYSPEQGNGTPNGGILFSDTFADDRIGILLDADYQENKVLANHVNVQGWEGSLLAPSQLAGAPAGASTVASLKDWFIQDYGVYQEHDKNERTDARIVLQWRPMDNLLFTVNDDYSRDWMTQDQYGYSVWFNNGSLTDVTQNSNGTLTSFVQPNTPTDFQGQVNGSVIQNNLIGFNAQWNQNSHLMYEFDADQSVSKLNPGGQLSSIDADVGYGPSGPNGTCNGPQVSCNGTSVGISGVGSNNLPYPTGIGPNGNAALFINNGIIGSHVLPMSSPQNINTVTQLKLQGTWTEDNLKFKYGLQYVYNKENLSEFDSFVNNDWQAYAGYGPASNNTGGVALPQNFFGNSFNTSNFINGFNNNGNLPPNILQFNPYTVLNYLQSLGNPQTTNIPGANKNCCTPPFNGIYQMAFNVGDYQNISETTFAPYVNLNTKTSIADMPLLVNVGLRYDRTETQSAGLAQLPTTLTVQASDHTAYLVAYTGTVPVETTNTYQYLLPNVDLNLMVTDQIKVRLDASRTLTRPPLNYLTPDTNVPQGQRVGSLVATGGNPNLLPYLSDNVDLGAEWYYAHNSYASIDGFVKNVTNFIVGGTTQQNINGVVLPGTTTPAIFSVTSQVNGPSAQVRGIELALQHMFWDTGFGFYANATFVTTNKPYNPYDTSVSGFAVTGLANSANLIAFYDKYGFQARVAVNHRDEYLDHFGQQQNNSAYGTEPTFVNASTQVDFSTSYQITKQLQVYFEALNLTDQTYSTHGRFSEQILDVVDYGRTFTLGVHFKL
jgi:iron complex outermembrane recepter protein